MLFSACANGALMTSNTFSIQELHLVRCLTHISHRYFAPGRALVISAPSNYRDVQQELIAEIHRSAIWPTVVTVDGNISNPHQTDFIGRDGRYIILIPDRNIKSLAVEFTGLAARRGKFSRPWNSEALFVVAAANELSIFQQKSMFHFLSQIRIYNCIIVRQEHYVLNKEYSRPINVNDVDTGMKLAVYTWFPYQSSDRCTEVNDITLLESWFISAQGHFTKNTDLFPRKIGNRLNGCPMKTFVRDNRDYFTTKYFYNTYSNGSVVRNVRGLEIKLLQVVLHQMNMTFFHVPKTDNFEKDQENLSRNLNMALYEKEIFIALGNIAAPLLWNPYIETTSVYFFTSIHWYVPCSIKYPRCSSVFRILSVELWLILLISIVIVVIIITLVGRYSCTSEWQGYKTLTSSLTNIFAVMLGVAVSTMPRTPSLRSLFLAWVCFSVAFSTVFQAFLTTFLIDSGYKRPIRNRDELFASDIKFAYLPGHNYIFKYGDEKEISKILRKNVNCPSAEVCLEWAMYHKNMSILMADGFADILYRNGSFFGENSEPLVCKLEDGVYYHTGITMLLLQKDPLLRRISEIIDRVVEAGIYNYWISLIFHGNKILSRKIAMVHPLDGYYSFNLYHMQTAFYLLFMGWCLSVLCFVVEFLYNRILSK
jgi:hypothetical protein